MLLRLRLCSSATALSHFVELAVMSSHCSPSLCFHLKSFFLCRCHSVSSQSARHCLSVWPLIQHQCQKTLGMGWESMTSNFHCKKPCLSTLLFKILHKFLPNIAIVTHLSQCFVILLSQEIHKVLSTWGRFVMVTSHGSLLYLQTEFTQSICFEEKQFINLTKPK